MSVKGLAITWNSVVSSVAAPGLYVQRVSRRMIGSVRSQRVAIPGRDGSYFFSERRGTRVITADCVLVADLITGRRADVVEVADWFDVMSEAELIFSDQSDRFWLASCMSDPDPDEWKRLGKFKLEWEAQSYAFATVISEEALVATGMVDSGSFAAADTLDAYPEVTITPSNGTITSLAWTLNGLGMIWSGLLPSGQSLVISSLSDSITSGPSIDTELTGAFDPNDVSMLTADGDFGLIQPGTNDWAFSWAGTATNVDIVVRWRRRYR